MSQAQLISPAESIPTFPAIAYKGAPVLTTEMLAHAYGVNSKQIRQNFSNNRERFSERKHFYMLSGNELKEFKNCVEIIDAVAIPPRTKNLTLWTDRGSARHAKMLESDKAWDVYEILEDTFFNLDKLAAEEQALRGRNVNKILTPSTPTDRAPLRSLVHAWSQVAGVTHTALWPQVKAHFQLSRIDDLPAEWIPDALAFVQNKIDGLPKALPSPSSTALQSVGRGSSRRKSHTEKLLEDLLRESNSLDAGIRRYEEWFNRLSVITGPLYREAMDTMRRTDDNVTPDSLISTFHYHRWYVRERLQDARHTAAEACRSAMVVARMMGV